MSALPKQGDTGPTFRFGSLQQNDRQNIVNAAGTQAEGSAFVAGNEVRLSALGATLDLLGTWQQTATNDLASWRQVTTDGRDQYVKTVYYGYHFPFGHTATLTTITKRVLSPDPVAPGQYADAYLQNKSFITTTETFKTYPAIGQPYGLGAWPFSSARILTPISPDLDPAAPQTQALGAPPPPSGNYPQAFFPTSGDGNPVTWVVQLVDNAGTEVSLRLPLAFVFATGANYPYSQFDTTQMGDIAAAYNALGQQRSPSSLVTSLVAGTPILYAPEVTTKGAANPGATTHPTLAITVGAATAAGVPTPTPNQQPGSDQYVPPISPASPASLSAVNQPAFYPSLLTAQIRLPAAETLSRSSLDDGTGPGGVAIFLYGPYITDGFNSPAASASTSDATTMAVTANAPLDPSGSTNPGAIYAGLLNKPPLSFPADMVGGLGNPNLGVNGLSAAAGAIGGSLSQYASKAEAIVADYFGALTSSQFLGGLSLADILGAFLGDLKAPAISQHVADDGTITVTYTLQAQLQSWTIFEPLSDDGMFTLTATVTIALSGATTFTVKGVVDAFTIEILDGSPIIEIPFGDASSPGATFTASSAAKSSIQVNVGQPTFEGALGFVDTLEQFLSDIGGSGVSLDVEPTQISASLSLSLPSVGVGVFNLENLSLSASVVVPFLGGATVATFGFCSQEQPFSLTVMCFGGGGYLLVAAGLTSLESLTASFDFEGQFALDLAVASGSVSVMAGITFSYAPAPAVPPATAGATLTGFVRITGEVEVLGILSISLEVQLSLSYNSANNTATGTATMTVSISLCFFSVSVSITVQKSFAGSGSSSSSVSTSATPQIAEAIVLPLGSGAGAAEPSRRLVTDAATPAATTSATTFKDQMSATDWSSYCAAFGS